MSHQQLNNKRSSGGKWFHLDEWSPGTLIFLPSGQFIFQRLIDYLRKQYKLRGYREVSTPDIWKNKLWMKSGHYDNYRENMFPVFEHWPANDMIKSHFTIPKKIYEDDNGVHYHDIEESYSLASMNCPSHYRIFDSEPRHLTDLPLRLAEFGTLHRNEEEGSLRGLFRVRKFHQDDAHIFCTPEQVADEISSFLNFLDETYTVFGFDYTLELSTKPAKALDRDTKDSKSHDLWEASEMVLKSQLKASGKKWELNEGDGAFYGPKIDVHLTDSLGRSHQCGTIQLDYQLPERFDIWYHDDAGVKHRPVVLHRAIFGSVERFMGILIEHYQGKLPLWLNDKQFIICTLHKPGQDLSVLNEYVRKLHVRLLNQRWSMMIDIDTSNTHIKQKIKSASDKGYEYILVVGAKEVENETVAIRQGRTVDYDKTIDDVVQLYDENIK